MKYSRRQVRGKAYAMPQVKFENQSLTAFAGLVVFQRFFALLRLKVRLTRCFAHQTAGKVFARATVFLQLVVHVLLGYRELRERRYDENDPLVKRLLGLQRLPDVATLHEGRGSQEGIFGELKTHCQMGYVPVRKWLGNQTYLLAGLFAHNLLRDLQMTTSTPTRGTTAKRTPLWAFEELHTFRSGLIQWAGRLTRPHGTLTLTISASHWIKHRLLDVLNALPNAA